MLFSPTAQQPSTADIILSLINATASLAEKNANYGWHLLYDDKTVSEIQETYTRLGSKGGKVNECNAVLGVALNVVARKLNGDTLSANELVFLNAVTALIQELDAKPIKLVPPVTLATDIYGRVTVSASA